MFGRLELKKWERAVQVFVDSWKDHPEVEAIVLAGSYAVGNQNKKSDIDVYIVLADSATWRERGLRKVGEFTIEYFINPLKQILRYLDSDLQGPTRVDANIFAHCQVILDKSGVARTLIERANKDLLVKRPPLSEYSRETAKYYIWDFFEDLEHCYRTRRRDYFFLADRFLLLLLSKYCESAQIVLPAEYKIYQYLTDPDFARRYGITADLDETFRSMFVAAVEERNRAKSFALIVKLKEYVVHRLGRFDPGNWSWKSEIDLG